MSELTQTRPRGTHYFANQSAKLWSAALLTLFITGYLYSQSLHIFEGWALLFNSLSAWSGLPSTVVLSIDGLNLQTALTLNVRPPSLSYSVSLSGAICVFCFAMSYLVKKDNVPARYLLRVVGLFLGIPAVGIALQQFTYAPDLGTYIADLFQTGFWFVVLTPTILGVTGLILPGNLLKKIGILSLCTLYLFFLVPVLALFHLHVLHLVGLSWIPFLSVFGKIFLMSFLLIAFYGLLAAQD